jgi:hypothetical protein
MKKFILVLIMLPFWHHFLTAQSATEALRYSALQYGGTARSLGVGNSMSVLGGDFTGIGINPAGLALFRETDLSFSMGYSMTSTDAQLRGTANNIFNQDANRVTFNNVGLVFASEPFGSGKWKTSNFAIGLNKLANFNRSIFYDGTSPGSMATIFKNQANESGIGDEFGTRLAFDSYAIDYDSTARRYFSDFDGNPNVPVSRSQSINTSGYVNEFVISYAGNYDEKLMLGVTLGIPFSKYEFNSRYSEEDATNVVRFFNRLNYNNNITTEGAGVNLKIGAIYRPIQALRLGLAVHTPTAFSLNEDYDADMSYSFTNNNGAVRENSATSPIGEVDYRVVTPWKFIGSAGIIVGKYGFITAEAEYLNYANARIRFDTPDSIGTDRINDLKGLEASIDRDINAQYKSAVNLRIGGELALEAFRLRAGWNYLGNAFVNGGAARNVFSFGAGVRGRRTYFDISYRTENQDFEYRRFEAGDASRQPTVDVSNRQNTIVATLGFRF